LILVLRPCFTATSTIIEQNLTEDEDTYPRIESVTLSMGSDGKVTCEDFKGIPQMSVAVIGKQKSQVILTCMIPIINGKYFISSLINYIM